MGCNISAAPSTSPLRIRNINFASEPRSKGKGLESQSNPPVTERTCNLAGTQRPLLKRRTATVVSAKCSLAARRGACDWGRDSICDIENMTRGHGIGDYGRACREAAKRLLAWRRIDRGIPVLSQFSYNSGCSRSYLTDA